MSNRDELRAATLGAPKQFAHEIIEWNGCRFELRQPSVGDRNRLVKQCMDDKGKPDALELMTRSVMACTFVPDTQEKVFDETDYDALVTSPSGGFVDRFGEKIMGLVYVDTGELEKNIGKTRSDS